MFGQVDVAAERGQVTELVLPEDNKANKMHFFRCINAAALNKSSQDELRVNFLEHWEVETRDTGGILNRFSWVADLEITPDQNGPIGKDQAPVGTRSDRSDG